MALRFGQTRGDDVAALIARKQYVKAIEVIKEQLKTQRNDPRVRIQLGDVLAMAGRPKEAVAVLSPLADEFAREGFATKAIAILKKIQKLDPTLRDVEARLAALIQEKQQQTAIPSAGGRRPELGMEALEDAGTGPSGGAGLELEIGFGAAPVSAPVVAVPPRPPPAPAAPPAPVEDHDLIVEEAAPVVVAFEPEAMEAVPEPEPVVVAAPPAPSEPAFIDLADIEPEAIEVEVEPEPIELDIAAIAPDGEDETTDDPRADALFAEELLAVIEDVFPTSAPPPAPPPAPAAAGPSRFVVSPLFQDFSVDEMVAVIQGLKLLAFEAGDVILSQGERGDSLYMLAAGRVKAFVRGADGRQAAVGEMAEGAFFGEIAILTGQPRSATIVAATRCELLELDRATLDAITRDHPRVWDVLREFADRRRRH